jgi:alpha-N-arabinofuranosidase
MSDTPLRVSMAIDPDAVLAPVNRRIFGSFVEHMGRGVYGGIYEPGHPVADQDGFRTDVLALVSDLGVSIVRYPGGNFVSGYRWEDGVGPPSQRKARHDRAWHSFEPNTFGLDEFAGWCAKAGTDMMLAVNLGTRGSHEAAQLVEYANVAQGTSFSELRRSHGREMPYAVKTWCLGNEVDGPWQIGHKSADEYGHLAAETAGAMRAVDPTLELVACGSSARSMPTFGSWDQTVLEHCYEQVDLISAHAYYDPEASDLSSFLASGVAMDEQIRDVAAIADRVGARMGAGKRIDISFDEWNVWYMGRHESRKARTDWSHAPRLCEDEFTITDAVVVGSLLITLLRHVDRVAVACQAQLVNTIAPIHAEPDLPARATAIFHPFALTSRFATGNILRTSSSGPTIATERHGEVPVFDTVVASDDVAGSLTMFSVNRSLTDPSDVDIDLSLLGAMRVVEHLILAAPNPTTPGTEATEIGPQAAPWHIEQSELSLRLPPVSWSMVRFARA